MENKYLKLYLIDNYIKENKISKTEFCKRCKISPQTLKSVYDEEPHTHFKTLFKIARTLNIKIYDLLI